MPIRNPYRTVLIGSFAAGFAVSVAAAEPPRLMRHPTASRSHVFFEYAGDLWSVPRAGGDAARLTSGPGREHRPHVSPDGSRLAFTGEYEGNADVYVVEATGGVPRRLTWHPGDDEAVGWTPDGERVLFRSGRLSDTTYPRLFTIGFEDGLPEPIALPAAYAGSYSPDGKRLAYVPHPVWQTAWKRYRGGQAPPVWIAELADGAVRKVPRDGSNDGWPMWIGDAVYFLSDRDGYVTLFRYDPRSGEVARQLPPGEFDILSATAGPGGIAYGRPGEIRIFDPATRADVAVPVRISADLLEVRPRWERIEPGTIQAAAISPSGVRALFEARGEIFSVPAEKGDVRNLTGSPGVADRDPAWSPDGKWIACFSDAVGEYALHIVGQDGRTEPRRIALGTPPSFFYEPVWSPDSTKIAFHDKRLTLWYVDVADGKPVRVDADHYETPERSLDPAWSPDSRWIVYTKQLPSYFHAVFAHELASRRSVQLTDGLADARYPVFDKDGAHLYFTASTNLGLAASWLDMSSYEKPVVRSVYVAVLRRDLPSPLAPQSDEEPLDGGAGATTGTAEGASENEKKGRKDEKEKRKAEGESAPDEPPAPPEVRIDVERIGQRTLALPVPAKNYVALRAGKAGELFLLEGPPVVSASTFGPPSLTLHKFTLAEREAKPLVEGIGAFAVAEKGEKLLYRQGDAWFVTGTDAVEPGQGALDLSGMQMLVEPVAEWRQMYREAWRIQRDFLYDPGHHGLDLERVAARYAPFVEGLGARVDLNELFEEMLGETTVGHTFVAGGDLPERPESAGGLLGADLVLENDRYRFSRVLDGESWNPDLRAPLTQPGVDVVAGEYLLAVNGRELRPPESPFRALDGTAGRQVVLRVGPDPAGHDARDVTVVPIPDESGLRALGWVESNRRTVERLSHGRLGYVYLPDTGGGGYTYFNRYFFAQIGKEGVVIDERHNGGGSLADYVVDHLSRPVRSRIATREGADQTSPAAAIYGPKVMIVNEMAGSGGDALPWYFRKAGLGPIVGTRTWGGLVGIYDYPPLIDGGFVTAPRAALYDLDGTWKVENAGIAPDVEVDLEPAAWREGRDSQLEAAVAIGLEALERNLVPEYPRPPYPDYHRGGALGKSQASPR